MGANTCNGLLLRKRVPALHISADRLHPIAQPWDAGARGRSGASPARRPARISASIRIARTFVL